MNEHAESDSTIQPNRPPRRRRLVWLRWLLVVVLLAGCTFLGIGWRPRLPSKPVHLERDENGRLAPDDNSHPSGVHLELHAGKISSKSGLTSASSESRPSQARFACRRMVVFNESEHLLMQRVGTCMLEHLKGLKGFDKIDYYPFGEKPDQGGELAPDVTVTLTLDEVKTSGLPGSRKLDARIRLSAGSGLKRYPVHEFDGLDPPQVGFDFSATLDHHSTTTGVGTPSSRFKLAAADIGKQLGEALVKKLNELYEKDGPLPSLPEAFYPPYAPPPDLPFPPEESAELVASFRGLMKSNESLWRLQTERGLADVLTDLEAALKEAGWKTNTLQTSPDSLPHLRMSRGEDVLMAFPERKKETATPGTIVIESPDEPPTEPKPESLTLFVHFVDRMSREEAAKSVRGLLDGGYPVQSLLLFESVLRGEDRKRLLGRVEADPPPSPDVWIVLAEWHHKAKRDEKAKEALHRAHLLLRTVAKPGDLQDRIDKLAEELEQELPRDATLDPELLETLGFVEITPEGVADRELGLDEAALFYARGDGELRTVAVRVVTQSGAGEARYGLAHVEAWDGVRSWGTGTLNHYISVDGLGSVTFHAEPIDDRPRFRLSTRVEATD